MFLIQLFIFNFNFNFFLLQLMTYLLIYWLILVVSVIHIKNWKSIWNKKQRLNLCYFSILDKWTPIYLKKKKKKKTFNL